LHLNLRACCPKRSHIKMLSMSDLYQAIVKMPHAVRQCTIIKLFTLAVCMLFSFGTYAQTGPGGIEDYTQSSNLKIWLSADSVTGLNDGETVDLWPDISFEGNDASQATANLRPIFETGILNGKPVLSFDGNDYIDTGSPGIAGSGSFDYYFVVIANTIDAGGVNDGGGDYILDRTTGTTELASLKATGGNVYGFQKRTDGGAGLGGPESTTGISTSLFQVVSFGRNRGTNYTIHVDGTEEDNAADDAGDLTPPALRIGRHTSTADNGLNGSIAEIVVFDKYLNDAERIIINNYLAAKYDLSVTNDFYSYEVTHNNNVAGIGRVDGSNIHTTSYSSVLRISDATDLDDGEFAFFGHNNGGVSSWTTTEIPTGAGDFERIAREWRIDKNGGDLGILKFQMGEASLPSTSRSDYAIMIDADGDFTSGSAVYRLTDIGGGLHETDIDHADIPDGSFVSLAVLDPAIQWEVTESNGFETNTSPSFNIVLNFTASSDVTVDYTTADGDATAGSDYTSITNQQATITSGNTSTTVNITVDDDGDVEDDEDFSVTLTNPIAGVSLGPNDTHTYVIQDNDDTREVSFVAASASGGEAAAPTVVVSVQVSPTDPAATMVDYEVTGGTATPGVDFTLTPGTVTIPGNAAQATFQFTVSDDAFEESNETIEITLSNPLNANLSETGDLTFTYTITNDDNVPEVQFPVVSSSGDESLTPVNVSIDLSAPALGDVTVDYTVGGLAIGGGVDHFLADGTVTIPSGEVTTSLAVAINDDGLPENTEDLVITLSNPSGAALGANDTFTYSITDNDEFGFSGPGGVGNSTLNRLWLRVQGNLYTDAAGTTSANDTDQVQRWEDISGNDNHATTTSNEPVFSDNAVNGKGVLTFADDDFIDPIDPGISNSTSGYNYFMVVKVNPGPDPGAMNDGAGDFILDRTSATQNLVSLKVTDDNGPDAYGFQKRTDAGSALGGPVSGSAIDVGNYEIIGMSRERIDEDNADYYLHVDGALEDFETGNPNEGPTTPPQPRIGRHATNANNGLDGDIAEFIIYGGYLGEARRIIVENYLAARYGINLSTNDKYGFEATHGEDVAGIGHESSGDAHEQAQSDDVLGVRSASSLDDGDYLLFGHDGGDATTWVTSETPDGSYQRIAREWAFDESTSGDGMGTLTAFVDPAGLSAAPANFDQYYLLIDDDGDFSNGGTTEITLSDNAGLEEATGVTIADGSFATIAVRNSLQINFVAAVSNIAEDGTSIDIAVNLTEDNTTAVDVDYTVTGGAATEGGGNDYVLADGTLNFAISDTVEVITITINDDAEVELEETIEITLSNPVNAVLGADIIHTSTISDNDFIGVTGPGGVGDDAINQLWIKADSTTSAAGEPSNGAGITEWIDVSGNGNNFAQDTGSPIYVESAINGLPAIRFDGNDGMNANDIISGNTGRTIFTVGYLDDPAPPVNTAAYYMEFNEDRSGGSGESYMLTMETAVRVSGNRVFNQGFGTTNYRLLTIRNATGDDVLATEGYLEGVLLGESSSSAATINTQSGGTYIGGYGTANATFEGDLAEIIAYDIELNDAQRIIVQNYLHTKYNLPVALTDDYYSYESTHSSDLAGIGRTSSTSIHTAARSANILQVSNADDLDDDEFILFGHDNADITSWTETEVPGDSIQRLAREWRVEEAGDIGTFTLSVNATDLPANPAGFSEYLAFIDADGDFSNGATTVPLGLQGGLYTAENVDINDGDFIAIGVVKPVIQFTLTEASNDESVTSYNLEVSLNYALASDVDVDYTVTGGTATGGGDDYTLADGTATIVAGSTTENIVIAIVDDGDTEDSETIIVDLSNPGTGVLGDQDQFTYTIEDNDNARKIDFTVVSSSGSESNTPAFVVVRINTVDGSNPTTVDYTVTGGTASGSGVDYTLAAGTATVAAGDFTGNIPITINSDVLGETDETIEITLTNPINANLGTNRVHTFTIVDDDTSLEANFTKSQDGASEGAGTVDIEVSLNEVAGSDISVDFSVTGGTATGGGTDYSIAASPLIISQGTSAGNISVVINDDGDTEGGETITLSLDGATGATIGAGSTLTFTISDNDNEGFTGPAGVGDDTVNKLWLRADSITGLSDTDPVAAWADVSGNSNDFAVDTGSPTFVSSAVNGLPAVRFDGDDGMNAVDIIAGNIGRTIFTVGKQNNSTGTSPFDSDADEASYFMEFNEDRSGGTGESYLLTFEAAVRVSNNKIFDQNGGLTDYRLLTFRNATGDNVTDTEAYYEGVALGESSSIAVNINTASGGTYIGGFGNSSATFEGDLAEVIVFDVELNEAQRIIVENYLDAKYNFNTALTNDFYAFENSHEYEVAGIGREDASNQHLAAQSGRILTISSPSDMGDGDYLIFGHDNGDITTWTTTDAPNAGSNISRLAREWRVDFDQSGDGDLGTLTVTLDSSMLAERPAGYESFVLMRDIDGEFDAGATIIPLEDVGNGSFEATGLSLLDNDYLAIGAVRQEIQFTLTSSQRSEPNGPGSIEISTNYEVANTISVDYDITGGSATGGGVDYTLAASGTVEITPGNTTALIGIPITNDTDPESAETIILDISNPSGAVLGANTTHTFTIEDDDQLRKIDFTSATGSGDEGVDSVELIVQLSFVDNTNPTTVDYSVTGGDATGSNIDYLLASGTFTVPATQSTDTVILFINEDVLREVDETVTVTLADPVNASIGTNDEFTYTILDNDPDPEIEFTFASASGSEAVSPANIEVSLSQFSGIDASVDFSVTGGTATGSGVDYTLADGSVTIPAGAQTVNIKPVIFDDSDIEGGETIEITLSSPTGATLGANSVITFTISDNDNDGFTGPGGVGNSDNNQLWIKADALGLVNNDPVNAWSDDSGNSNDFAQATGSPVFIDNAVNGLPVVRFDGDDGMDANDIISGDIGRTIFAVTIQNASSGVSPFDSDPDEASYFLELNKDRSGGSGQSYMLTTEVAVRVSGNRIYDDGLAGGVDYRLITIRNAAGDNVTATEGFLDGATLAESTSVAADINTASGGTYIGGFGNSSPTFEGDIAEIVVYDNRLNDAQRIIVDNYLAAKYDLDITNSKYGFEGLYGNDVAGVGQVDASNAHIAAQSGAILKVSSPDDLDDDEFLLFGHDGASAASWSTTEAPNSGQNIQRIAREWAVDLNGDVGNVTLGVDITGLPAKPSGFETYYALVDSDGDFSNGASLYPLEFTEDTYHEGTGIPVSDGQFVTVAIVRNVVQFTSATSNEFEPNGPATVSIDLNYPLLDDINVDYQVTGGSATGSGADYTLTSGTATITAGNTNTNIAIPLTNDVEVESDETVVITLSNPPSNAVLGTNNPHTFTIQDDDNLRKIYFDTDADSGDESVTPYTVTVNLTPAEVDPTNDTEVDIVVSGSSTAEESTDFTLSATTVTIPANNTSATFDITIVDDNIREDDEVIILDLLNPVNGNLANPVNNPIQFEYTILDNEPDPSVEFASTTSTVGENGASAQVPINLSGESGQTVTVDYTLSGTATSGDDYIFSAGTATFLAGETTQNLNITLLDDSDLEGVETLIITLTNNPPTSPSNADLGTNTVHTLNINDDDNAGFTGPGGVGDMNNNKLWIKADELGLSNNDPVNSWPDESGNGNDFSQDTGSPAFITNAVNSLPVVRFDGNDGMNAADIVTGNIGRTLFTVGIQNNSTGTSPFNSDADEASYFLELNEDRSGGSGRSYMATMEVALRVSGNKIFDDGLAGGSTYRLITMKNATGDNVTDTEAYLDGTQLGESSSSAATINTNSGGTYIGGFGTSNATFDGDLAEIAIFNTELNEAQRRIVENYLAAKYGLTITNDHFAEVQGANYGHEVIGIGQVSGEFHTTAQSGGLIKIDNPGGLGDNEFLFLGHDDGNISNWTTTESPNVLAVYRVAREWYIDETGDVGDLVFSLADASLLDTPPVGYESYVLITDADGDFSSGATITPLTSVGGDEYQASAINLSDGYFTIGAIQNITIADGDFSNTATWASGVVPASGQGAIIDNDVFLTQDITVGALTIQDGEQLDLDGFNMSINDQSITVNGSGQLLMNNGTITYNGAGAQCITGLNYHNLVVSGSGTKTLCGDVDVDGDLTVNSTLDVDGANDYTINIAGDFDNNGTFVQQQGMIVFDGTSDQAIEGTLTLYQVTVSKASGAVVLNTNPTISNQLDMASGDIVLGNFDLTIASTASVANADASSYIQADGVGTLIREIGSVPAAAFTFDVGDVSGNYTPFTFTLNAGSLGASPYVGVNLRDLVHPSVTSGDNISRYWTIEPNDLTSPQYDISFQYVVADENGTETNIAPIKFSTDATINDFPNGTLNVSTNTITWSDLTSFSDITASGDAGALPVELLYFDGWLAEGKVELEWLTTTEVNNSHFVIEKAGPQLDFEAIGEVNGAGDSSEPITYQYIDEKPLVGLSYYRLKQVDLDGAYSYSNTISVEYYQGNVEIYALPNPVKDYEFTINVNGLGADQEVLYYLTDIIGNPVKAGKLLSDISGQVRQKVKLSNNMPSGIYLLKVESGSHSKITRLMIK